MITKETTIPKPIPTSISVKTTPITVTMKGKN